MGVTHAHYAQDTRTHARTHARAHTHSHAHARTRTQLDDDMAIVVRCEVDAALKTKVPLSLPLSHTALASPPPVPLYPVWMCDARADI